MCDCAYRSHGPELRPGLGAAADDPAPSRFCPGKRIDRDGSEGAGAPYPEFTPDDHAAKLSGTSPDEHRLVGRAGPETIDSESERALLVSAGREDEPRRSDISSETRRAGKSSRRRVAHCTPRSLDGKRCRQVLLDFGVGQKLHLWTVNRAAAWSSCSIAGPRAPRRRTRARAPSPGGRWSACRERRSHAGRATARALRPVAG